MSPLFQLLAAGVLAACSCATAADVEALLQSMTLEEKVGQMVQIDISVFMDGGSIDLAKLSEWVSKYRIGSLLNSPFSFGPVNGISGWTAEEWRENIIAIQTAVASAGGIPIIYGIDSIHGATFTANATLFPQQIGLAATFNRDLAVSFGLITSKDTRASGIPWVFSPVLGIAHQPLWSRFYETFGEDPFLASVMGAAVVEAYQRDTEDDGFPERVAACMKHFIAYSDPANGHDRSPVQLPHRMLKQMYADQFQAAVDAGVLTAMESYQEVGGVPMVSSRDYLKKLLRVEMNFTGFMVTDYQEIENLHSWHSVAETQEEAVRIVLQDTSVDQSMVPLDESFYEYTLGLVNSGAIPESRVDESARRVLQVKQALGLLDTPIIPDTHPLMDTVGQAADWEASLNASRESITLLKNENLLPIQDTVNTKLFVTGPTCDSLVRQSGGWSVHWQGATDDSEFGAGTTVLEGLRGIYDQIEYNPGPAVDATSLDGIDEAAVADAVAASDVVVVCVGEETYTEKPGDIDDLTIASGQSQYVNLLNSSGSTPIVLIIISGRPRLLNGCAEQSDAVLEAYLPGPMGGQAVAEIIAGIVVPSGRIPFTYPKNAGDIPYPYNRKPNDMCTDPNNGFSYIECEVEWKFGTGLSYTTFEYGALSLSGDVMSEKDDLYLSVLVTNTGSVDASHTVMFFLFDMYRRVTPEYKSLKGFEKFFISAGDTVNVTLKIQPSLLEYVGVDGWKLLESGEFRVAVGHETDCRQDATDCAVFTLQTSDEYYPVCDYGCDLWAAGLCGRSVDYSTCRSQCESENWDWNYIGCLET
ncbi:unnamed protein product, partial [Ectocarpus fasciculatus]